MLKMSSNRKDRTLFESSNLENKKKIKRDAQFALDNTDNVN